ncbi:MAG: hypothetical protein AB9903_25260 [Vulcanimicrobiota bacterium]
MYTNTQNKHHAKISLISIAMGFPNSVSHTLQYKQASRTPRHIPFPPSAAEEDRGKTERRWEKTREDREKTGRRRTTIDRRLRRRQHIQRGALS